MVIKETCQPFELKEYFERHPLRLLSEVKAYILTKCKGLKGVREVISSKNKIVVKFHRDGWVTEDHKYTIKKLKKLGLQRVDVSIEEGMYIQFPQVKYDISRYIIHFDSYNSSDTLFQMKCEEKRDLLKGIYKKALNRRYKAKKNIQNKLGGDYSLNDIDLQTNDIYSSLSVTCRSCGTSVKRDLLSRELVKCIVCEENSLKKQRLEKQALAKTKTFKARHLKYDLHTTDPNIVYYCFDKDTGKYYVGITTVGLKERVRQHLYNLNSFFNVYKLQDHKLQWGVLYTSPHKEEECIKLDLHVYERYFIKKLKSFSEGYNRTR